MVLPTIVACGVALFLIARDRPRTAYTASALAWLVLRAAGDVHTNTLQALARDESILGAAAFAAAGCLIFVPALRRPVLSSWGFRRARARRDTLDAAAALRRRPDWDADLGGPLPTTLDRFLGRPAEAAATSLDGLDATRPQVDAVGQALARHAVDSGDDFRDAWSTADKGGLTALELPADWGGQGLDAEACARSVRRAASRSAELGATVASRNLGGMLGLVLRYGTPVQRATWVTRLVEAEGRALITWIGPAEEREPLRAVWGERRDDQAAQSEPTSDHGAAPRGAELRLDGALGRVPALGGEGARWLAVAVEVAPAPDSVVAPGTTVILLDAEAPGVTVLSEPQVAGYAPTASIRLSDVRVGSEAILGAPETTASGADAYDYARAMHGAVAWPSIAAGVAQRDARLLGNLGSLEADGRTNANHGPFACAATGTLRLRALARTMASVGARRIPADDEIEAVGSATTRLALEGTAAFDALTGEGARSLPARASDSARLPAIAAVHRRPRAARSHAESSAPVLEELSAAAESALPSYDALRSLHRRRECARWTRAFGRTLRRALWRRNSQVPMEDLLTETLALHSIVSAAAARTPLDPTAPRSIEVAASLTRALESVATLIATQAAFVVDGRQSTESMLLHAAQCEEIDGVLNALESAAKGLGRVGLRSMTRAAILGVRLGVRSSRVRSEHAATALTGHAALALSLTADVIVDRELSEWDRGAASARAARAPLRRIAEARTNGQLPDVDGAPLLEAAIARGLISKRDRAAIEHAWSSIGRSQDPDAALRAVS